tara:strand:- start:181 stop:612 length:432 start_codon:yes stop_codon:yes gene_type:complete
LSILGSDRFISNVEEALFFLEMNQPGLYCKLLNEFNYVIESHSSFNGTYEPNGKNAGAITITYPKKIILLNYVDIQFLVYNIGIEVIIAKLWINKGFFSIFNPNIKRRILYSSALRRFVHYYKSYYGIDSGGADENVKKSPNN